MKIKIFPISIRAKNRVNEHGNIMILLEQRSDKILVQSVNKTWNGNTDFWKGWFSLEECNIVRWRFDPLKAHDVTIDLVFILRKFDLRSANAILDWQLRLQVHLMVIKVLMNNER